MNILRTPFLITLSVVAMVPASVQSADSPANVLPNPSFEERVGNGVTGWTPRAWHGEEHAHAENHGH